MERKVQASEKSNVAQNTRLPNTEVIADALHTTEVALHETSVKPPPELDAQGRRLLTDLENLTATERRMIEEKNPDSLVQKILEEGRLAIQDLSRDLKGGTLQGVDKQTAKQMMEQTNTIVSDIQGLIMEIITSAQFRQELLNLLECCVLLAQEVTGVPVTNVTDPLKGAKHEMKAAKRKGETKEHAKGKAKELKEGMKDLAKGVNEGEVKPLDDEQLERLMEQLRSSINEISRRPKSRRVIRGLFEVITLFSRHYAIQQNASKVKSSVDRNVHLTNLATHIRTLVERFTGGEVIEILIAHAKAIADISYRDEDVQSYFHDVRMFMTNAMDNPERLEPGNSGDKELRRLVIHGRKLFNRKELREHFIGVINYTIKTIQQFMNDPHVAQLQNDIRQFIADLVTDEDGNFVITKNALNQLKVILVSSLLERMAIPIPMITHEDEKMEFEISNLWLVLRDVIPDMVHLEFREAVDLDTRNLRSKGVGMAEENLIIVHAMNMNYSIKDANVWWKRKKFPKSEDSGVLEMNMPGEGIELRIVLTMKLKDTPNSEVFRVRSIDCDIDKIALKLAGTKHDKLYNLFLNVAKGGIKKRIETAIEEKIAEMIGLLNGEIARQVVSAGAAGKRRIVGTVSKTIENATGLAITPELANVTTDKHRKEPMYEDSSSHHKVGSKS